MQLSWADVVENTRTYRDSLRFPDKADSRLRDGILGGFKRSSQRGLCRLIGETGQAPLRASSNQASFGAAS